MDPREWFNLRNIYQSRFTTRPNSRKYPCHWHQKVMSWCSSYGSNDSKCCSGSYCSKLRMITVVGGLLILMGIIQFVAGVYFMICLPVFQIGSNIWTGAWTLLCGIGLALLGARGRGGAWGGLVLTATVTVLVLQVANLVIIKVGENGVFLTKQTKDKIVDDKQEIQLIIAFWLSMISTCLSIVISFFGAQYLFCLVVRGPRIKGQLPVTRTISEEGLHHRQDGNDGGPSLEDVIALPDPAKSSAWVYRPDEDKTIAALYPMGLDSLQIDESGRRAPMRHASFVTPRYARVHQRPQRAQSFATRREFQSMGGEIQLRTPHPVTVPELPRPRLITSHSSTNHYAKPARKVQRSSSFSDQLLSGSAATLSRKFHACSMDEVDSTPVIEVGSLASSQSESSLADALIDHPLEISLPSQYARELMRNSTFIDGRKVLTSFTSAGYSVSRIIKPKGPAPPPPIRPKKNNSDYDMEIRQENNNNESHIFIHNQQDDEKITSFGDTDECNNEIEIREVTPIERIPESRNHSLDRPLPLPVIEENIKNINKRPAPQPRNTRYKDLDARPFNTLPSYKPFDGSKPKRSEIIKPPRSSLIEKPPRLADKNMTLERKSLPIRKPERKRIDSDTVVELQRLEEVLSSILDHGTPLHHQLRATKSDESITDSLILAETRPPKGILKKNLVKPGLYENAHREALLDTRVLLEKLPSGELQRNKIVLRVPSFRTAGCQTDSYRPVRRRASCAQTNLSVAPRHRDNSSSGTIEDGEHNQTDQWTRPATSTQQTATIESSSSSSGYSSPEVSSKDPSPAQSGPPSPAGSDEEEKHMRTGDSNVTIIQVNRSTSPPHSSNLGPLEVLPPPRPPKPQRLRHSSDASTLGNNRGLLVPVHKRPAAPLPFYEDAFGLATLTENVMLLTEAINPVLVQTSRNSTFVHRPNTAPRVVDVIHKDMIHTSDDRLSRADVFAQDGRRSVLARPRTALRTHSLSLPRPRNPESIRHYDNYTISSNFRHFPNSSSRSPSPPRPLMNDASEGENHMNNSSTAAYLTSLELLASHYRHQALANAKQLQLQQQLLHQQKLRQFATNDQGNDPHLDIGHLKMGTDNPIFEIEKPLQNNPNNLKEIQTWQQNDSSFENSSDHIILPQHHLKPPLHKQIIADADC